jgi:hypothetical protein
LYLVISSLFVLIRKNLILHNFNSSVVVTSHTLQ